MGKWRLILAAIIITSPCVSANAPDKNVDSNITKSIGPASVKVKSGDVLIRIDGPKMWTISRIEYKDTLLGVEDSAYGTVFKFTDIGFLGTGHFLDRPDGKENVKQLDFYADGKKLDNPPEQLNVKSFRLHKTSTILDCNLDSSVILHDNIICEIANINTTKKVSLDVTYNFMHAWIPCASNVLAYSRTGQELNEKFDNEGRKEFLLKDLQWAAVYDANSCKGAVSYLLAVPKQGGGDLLIVNAPNVYRKYYVMSFVNQPLEPGFNGIYKMVTAFFEAPEEKWTNEARRVAEKLRTN